MQSADFLRAVLPSTGTYVLTIIRKPADKKRDYTNNLPFTSIDALVEAAAGHDTQPDQNVYFACASFRDGTLPANAGLRKAENALYVRSLWADIDLKPDTYATRTEAVHALVSFCNSLGLPLPLMVKSGGGLHVYWCYDQDVPAAEATRLGIAMKTAAKRFGFHLDQTRTADMASVLRLVGTTWRKGGKEKPVTCVHKGTVLPVEAMRSALAPFTVPEAPPELIGSHEEFGKDYPPTSIHTIAQQCLAVGQVAAGEEVVPEPLWRDVICLTKFCEEGEAVAHEWSRSDDRYSEEETQAKLDGWTMPPATCARIESDGGPCTECPHHGKKGFSPIHLGYHVEEEKAPEPAAEGTMSNADARLYIRQFANKMPDEIPFWPAKYRWDGHFLCVAVKNKDEIWEWIPFADKFFYPYMRVRLENGDSAMRICTKGRGEDSWRELDLTTPELADNKALVNRLAGREIYHEGKHGVYHMRAFMKDITRQIELAKVETRTLNNFGWVPEGFVLGDTLITNNDEFPVLLGSRVPDALRSSFSTRGTLQGWVDAVDAVYNRPGAEPYQFIMCAALASPLVELCESDMWHGIPIGLTGASGLGKTTTCLAAVSAYGQPGRMLIGAHEQSTTTNAMLSMTAVMHNMAFILDEIHRMRGQDMPNVVYAMSNGKPKAALKSDRSFHNEGLDWNLIPLVTGNVNLTSLLAQFEEGTAQAAQVRVFEIALPEDFNQQVFADINAKDMIENAILNDNYGHAGRVFLRAVMTNEKTVRNSLRKMRNKYVPNDQEMTRERFFYDLVATTMVAAGIASKLGLIKFDLKKLNRWALNHIKTLRTMRVDSLPTADEKIYSMLEWLAPRTVSTASYPNNRGRGTNVVEYVDPSRYQGFAARHVRDRDILIILPAALRSWSAITGIHPKTIEDLLERHEYTMTPVQFCGNADPRVRPFRGTSLSVAATQARCLILDLNKMRAEGNAPQLHVVQNDEESTQTQN